MKHILLIEDNLEVRENTQELLQLAGYEVTTAENGKVGVVKATEVDPDLIICDIMMPELDGYGVIKILSRNPETAVIPFIFLTAKADKSDIRMGMNLGADDYLTKPFDETDLLDAIESRFMRHNKISVEESSGLSGLQELVSNAADIPGLEELDLDYKNRRYDAKEVVYREGDRPHYLYYVLKGSITSSRTDPYGKNLITETYNEGDYFGYISLFQNSNYVEEAVALSDAEVAQISKDDFLKLVSSNRDVAVRFIKLMAGNVADKEERLLKLAYATVKERLADVLLELSNNGEKEVSLGRETLAEMVGTSTETLIRTLTDMKNAGILESEGRAVYVKNPGELSSMVDPFH